MKLQYDKTNTDDVAMLQCYNILTSQSIMTAGIRLSVVLHGQSVLISLPFQTTNVRNDSSFSFGISNEIIFKQEVLKSCSCYLILIKL